MWGFFNIASHCVKFKVEFVGNQKSPSHFFIPSNWHCTVYLTLPTNKVIQVVKHHHFSWSQIFTILISSDSTLVTLQGLRKNEYVETPLKAYSNLNINIINKRGRFLQNSDEGLTLEYGSFETLNGGQFTLSTQLIIPNYL